MLQKLTGFSFVDIRYDSVNLGFPKASSYVVLFLCRKYTRN